MSADQITTERIAQCAADCLAMQASGSLMTVEELAVISLFAEVQRLTELGKKYYSDVAADRMLALTGQDIHAVAAMNEEAWQVRIANVQRLTEEARRSDAGRVEVPDLPGHIWASAHDADSRDQCISEVRDWYRDWIFSRLSPSPQPSADVVVVLDRVAACARDFQDRQRNLTVSRDSWGFFQSDSALESALKSLDALRSSTNHDSNKGI